MDTFRMSIGNARWKTLGMTEQEIGIYLQIIWRYYYLERGISDDLDDILRVLKVRTQKKKAVVENILSSAFTKVGGVYLDKDIEKDIKKKREREFKKCLQKKT